MWRTSRTLIQKVQRRDPKLGKNFFAHVSSGLSANPTIMNSLPLLNLLLTFTLPLLIFGVPEPGFSHHLKSNCPPFSGNFTISAYQLYPENGDFDFNHCVLYIG